MAFNKAYKMPLGEGLHLFNCFDSYNIKNNKSLDHLIQSLKIDFSLSSNAEIEQYKKDRIKQRISKKVFNPVYESLTSDQQTSFIQNKKSIEFILKQKSPSKEQVMFVLALIDSDDAYQQYFYKRLNNLSWFRVLEKRVFLTRQLFTKHAIGIH
jgi:hypothetical protein